MNNHTTPYLSPAFSVTFTNPYAEIYYDADSKTAVLRATETYIPINVFKQLFEHIEQKAKSAEVLNLIFDKRQLTTFDQPSMEWYFAIWKPAAKQFGLINHYKLLPDLDWFKKSVEAGKNMIYHKFGKEFLSGINICYVDSIEEALDRCGKNLHN